MAKLSDEPQLAEFLRTEMAATVALAVDNQGTIHVASLIYWHREEPLKFYFVTGKNSEKCKLLQDGRAQNAGCVIGTVRDVPFTLQMRGLLSIVSKEPYGHEVEMYAKKRGNNHDLDLPDNVLLEFVPDWARFTDYSKGWQHHKLEL